MELAKELFDENKLESYYEKLDHHKKEVFIILVKAIFELSERAINHDESKFNPIEKKIFSKNDFKYKFGTKEYENNKENLKIALRHHYALNRHHPEFFEYGIEEMNLIDLLEMIADWMSASKHYENGDINKSINILKTKYKIGLQLEKVLRNTVEYLKNE